MEKNIHKDMVQTVLGKVKPDTLGITLPHEHILIDMSVWYEEPEEPEEKALAHQLVNLDNLSWVRWNVYNNKDNLVLQDEKAAIKEIMPFKNAGGATIIDMTSQGLGRDPKALARISRATGINVIMGTGFYVGTALDKKYDLNSEEELADIITREITQGIDETGICAGVIGEVGCQWPLSERETKSLRASAKAQRNTGVVINIHPGRHEDSPMAILKILDKAGADLHRVVMSHIDRTGFLPRTRYEIAETGCILEYDGFGAEPFYPLRFGVFDRPSDVQRIREIIDLTEKGYLSQILISQDICMKIRLTSYGGIGYTHILKNVLPQMRARGMSASEIDTILIDNPKRFTVLKRT